MQVFDQNTEELVESATFKIVGLSCSCEGAIVEKRLKKLRGVADFALNTFTSQLTVSFDPEAVTLADIQQSVAKAGVKPVLLRDSMSEAAEPQTFGGSLGGGCCGGGEAEKSSCC